MISRILGLVVAVGILFLPDDLGAKPDEREKPRNDSGSRRRRSGNRGTGSKGNARELKQPAPAPKPGELENDDVREASGGGPGGPVRRELDSAVEVDLQPVIVPAGDPAETPQP